MSSACVSPTTAKHAGGDKLVEQDAVGAFPSSPPKKHSASLKRESVDRYEEDEEDGEDAGTTPGKGDKKRRKVNHACVYCRRSHMTCDDARPCTRCIKRDIGHLCHDEPKDAKKGKFERQVSSQNSEAVGANRKQSNSNHSAHAKAPPQQPLVPAGVGQLSPGSLSQPADSGPAASGSAAVVSGLESRSTGNLVQQYHGGWNATSPELFSDIHSTWPNYLFNTSEVAGEYNLLNDFLSPSFLDDQPFIESDLQQQPNLDGSLPLKSDSNMSHSFATMQSAYNHSSAPTHQITSAQNGGRRQLAGKKNNPAQEKYYMTAADPKGSGSAEERLRQIFEEAKQTGKLKGFDYPQAYTRMMRYMKDQMPQEYIRRIQNAQCQFRPAFGERMRQLSEDEVLNMEMSIELKLMEQERIFASMAIPACCWRRTGDILRGNAEMAELLNVPLEQLRDGKLALHDIMESEPFVEYWEKFSSMAFCSSNAVLTSCVLKTRDETHTYKSLRCCFSFTIHRNEVARIPSLIIGNFLPITTSESAQGGTDSLKTT